MRWLVTGGCGFIGRNFIRLLLTRSNDTIRVVDDLSDSANNVAKVANSAAKRVAEMV